VGRSGPLVPGEPSQHDAAHKRGRRDETEPELNAFVQRTSLDPEYERDQEYQRPSPEDESGQEHADEDEPQQ
jgi:hypothetical protein